MVLSTFDTGRLESPGAAEGTRPLVLQLHQSVEATESGQEQEALALLDDLLAHTYATGTPVERVVRAFALGLKARLSGDASGIGNLYMEGCDPGRMLSAFQVLVQATPFIRFGYAAANAALVHALDGSHRIHIIDIGIGSGAEWLLFLDTLASHSQSAPSIRLTGIDVPAPGEPSSLRLQQVGNSLRHHAVELGMTLTFEPVVSLVQDLDLCALHSSREETLAVNAAFALHHIPGTEGEDSLRDRDAVLRSIGELRPRILTLVEPDVEHHALPLLPRVIESLLHYLTVFDALEQQLSRNPVERTVLENAFFGREILNIVVGEGTARVERHERHISWHDRLCKQGFTPIDMAQFADDLKHELRLRHPFALSIAHAALLLTWRTFSVIAASAWKSQDLNESQE